MKCIAIIPARGGSKRIPRKNIKLFSGKPIIAYSIELASQSGLFDEIMVSTDDDEIAQVAKEFGASVPFLRSAQNANDFATTADVILEVLYAYETRGQHFDFACCIYPTSPLLKSTSLHDGFELLLNQSYDTVFPVVAFSYPIWRSLKVAPENGKVEMFWPENKHKRSQDLPKAYHDAGQFYWLNVHTFLNEPLLYSSNSGVIELSEVEVQDIDTLVDWQLAELKVQLLK
jgi:N-acylneuraminate cytidylyltransferase